MVTYVCLGVLILFVSLNSISYFSNRKKSLTSEEIDELLISIVNGEGNKRHE